MKHIYLLLVSVIILADFASAQNPKVEITTTLGTIKLEIFKDKAPITANYFLENVNNNVFKDACFYRVVRMDNQPNNDIKIEVIQGGLFFDSIVDQKPTIAHETTKETGILHTDGVISMARNQPGSASTEFFICIGDQPNLDFEGMRNPDGQGFAAFGKVIKGMDVVKLIQQQKDDEQMLVERIDILSITGVQ
ncbi:peptidylprolyl isomerase [Labilibaculum euxinus]|uniref:peptidylprolyl isomerase n=1 Tax=Labilibaculum euxinus TaxID=2686357 RepID=A0A7M4D8Q2_9BACT|nr:peptidylprolyl isomerase [Labilibaculum euxinus]MUP39031.1 peptidylprolyl isomerase [Labilibaculum euxinus]MVB08236.1 peptidylprolyl isomerase [Labilibaculum euxinus]